MKRRDDLLKQTPRLAEHDAEIAIIDTEMQALLTEVGNKEAVITLQARVLLELIAQTGLNSPAATELQTKMARFEASPLKNELLGSA